MAREDIGVVVKGAAKHFPTAPPAKFQSWHNMHQDARNSIQTFERDKAAIAANEDLSDKGKAAASTGKIGEFDALHQRWRITAEKRAAELGGLLAAVSGSSARDAGDGGGRAEDVEDRAWFKGLEGDERIAIMGSLMRGELPNVANALLRKDRRQTGLDERQIAALREVSVAPGKEAEATAIREELAAIQAAHAAFEKAKDYILGQGDPASVDIQARDALASEGLQKAEGDKTVEPFVAPEVEPFEANDDGVIAFTVTKNEDAA